MTGETGPIVNVVSLPVAMVIGGFFALACYNCIEIYGFIYYTFKRKQGLYFWSMLMANSGIWIHALAVLLRFFSLAPNLPMSVVICLGWFLMVTGQAFVLYSRLHLVVGDPRKIRWVLIMIVTMFLVVQIPTALLFITTNSNIPTQPLSERIFMVYENIQIAAFTLQETIISGLYVYEASVGLKLMDVIKGPRVRAINRELIGLFVLVVTLDITLMITEYTGNFQIQTTYKPVVYSIKLKVEALVLNNLLSLVQSSTCSCWDSVERQYSLSERRLTESTVNTGLRVPRAVETNSSIRSTSEAAAWMDNWGGIYDGRPRFPKKKSKD
ncbi:hypothetical protein BKA67DRAFT_577328 [Truncatella angustata]|uniref:DUF7703 domain-containing protein n=1 Tax=Truncatella angustata TaxID=152316 RepID=A0A9P8UCZ6_9PEZI|nr:uncharacterized protein BKA67DRAFT_577328 [Truncatella angustata]KAH6647393.1 hypothetical protein BKA67DRAFT_577328 [Truncatella angustata]KAH8203127.1 hypothetical protein TruAng_002648 [Truncatella angustata]